MAEHSRVTEDRRRDRGKVLIVGDDPESLEPLVAMLVGASYKVKTEANSSLVRNFPELAQPDCILIEWSLSEPGGIELCRRLKDDEKFHRVPVLFIGEPIGPKDRVAGFRAGAADYIARPFQKEEVLVRVETQVSLSRLRGDLVRRMEERDRFLEAVRQAAGSIVITDAAGSIQFVNPAFEAMTGYRAEEVLGKNPRILQSGKHGREFYREMWHRLLNREVWKGELINRKKDGTLFVEQATISPVVDKAGQLINYIAVKYDITLQRSLEEQLRQAQKMEVVGRLAGGVAHDFNNMIAVILGTVQMMLLTGSLDETTIRNLKQIQTAAQRSADITRQLLAFSRKQVLDPKVVDVNSLVRDITKMLSRLLGEDIDINFLPDRDIGKIMIDPGQLHQIIINLSINARDAMPKGGKLTLETAEVVFDEEYCRAHVGFHPGDYVMLAVSDTGVGMDEEIIDHIFEPFFTTKEQDKGTGLGLASVYGAVKHSGGFINVYSEPGVGTTFKLYFPVCAETGEHSVVGAEVVETAAPLTVLLAEDNRDVRELTASMLEIMGHRVIVAETPQKVLEYCRETRLSADLLLTDVVMPGMAGKELQKLVQELCPGIKTLFMSGYTASVISRHGVLEPGVYFLQKPFSVQDLARKINEIFAD
ncbi:MAG: response regulator [Deltaproteobacteria bacterium]|nr:response regulator [Deltaproteobacteria bacterium]